jgi:hypothetical protein
MAGERVPLRMVHVPQVWNQNGISILSFAKKHPNETPLLSSDVGWGSKAKTGVVRSFNAKSGLVEYKAVVRAFNTSVAYSAEV